MSMIRNLFYLVSGRRLTLMVSCLLMVVAGTFWPSYSVQANRSQDLPGQLQLHTRYELPLSLPSEDTAFAQPQTTLNWQTITVREGDSLARLFARAGQTPQTVYRIMRSGNDADLLKRLHPGEQLHLGLDSHGRLKQLKFAIDERTTLLVEQDNTEQYQAHKEVKPLEYRQHYASATITSNFWNAGVDAGLTPNLIMQLANVFGWDVDFALDLRAGDAFNIIYEAKYLNGEYVGDGDIIAAELINRGERLRAVRYQDGNYYAPDGHAMRKAFLRAPVNFKYISSNFNPRRLHPVTGRVRPHNGIDYAAAVGTPIMAAGDGKVIKAGYNRFNGNYAFIRHGATYVTKYLHMHRRYAKLGQRVKQGQVIGTVGATGRVTGPHLHYEFLVNGVHRNPRTVKLPESRAIAKAERATFTDYTHPLLAQLDNNRRVLLAMRSNDEQ